MLRVRPLGPASSPAQYIYETAQKQTSSNTFSFLASSSSSQSGLKRAVHITKGGTEEEIAWFDCCVVWSRAAEVYRRWTFERTSEDERVTWAGFVWFPPQGQTVSSTGTAVDVSLKNQFGRSDSNAASQSSTGRAPNAGTFGPFQTSHQATWGQPSSSKSSVHSISTQPKLVRAVLICLTTKAIVYYPSGESYTIHLPFLVEMAFPLPSSTGGVVLQRHLEKREIRKLRGRRNGNRSFLKDMAVGMTSVLDEFDIIDDTATSLPRLYTLSNPFEELRVVTEATVIGSKTVGPEETPPYQVEILHLVEGYPLVVAYDPVAQQVVFYAWHTIPVLEPETRPDDTYLSPQALLAPLPTPSATSPNPAQAALGHGGRPSLARTASNFSTTERRVSSLAAASEAMDRTRRGPRVSRGGVVEPQLPISKTGTDELQATLDPPTLPVPSHQPPRTRAKTRPRVSIAANETTTARRQSVASFHGHGNSMVLEEEAQPLVIGAGERDLRETTMMMGLEQEDSKARSEVVLERIWTWEPPE